MYQKGLSFRTVDDLLAYLPEEELKLVGILRNLILDCIPDCREKISYNVPFYARHHNICFIWPASVPWGGIKSGVALGFTRGMLLTDQKKLIKGKRKNVRSLEFTQPKDLDVELVKSLLYEAVLLDAE